MLEDPAPALQAALWPLEAGVTSRRISTPLQPSPWLCASTQAKATQRMGPGQWYLSEEPTKSLVSTWPQLCKPWGVPSQQHEQRAGPLTPAVPSSGPVKIVPCKVTAHCCQGKPTQLQQIKGKRNKSWFQLDTSHLFPAVVSHGQPCPSSTEPSTAGTSPRQDPSHPKRLPELPWARRQTTCHRSLLSHQATLKDI